MRIVDEARLSQELSRYESAEPRVVASGNFATPKRLLEIFDQCVERYRLFVLNAQDPMPNRSGVIHETPFVGPGFRSSGRQLDYLPMRLSLVPQLFDRSRSPDVVLVHTSPLFGGKVSLGIEVNIMVAAIERVRFRGGIVIAQINKNMPYTFGDGEVDAELIDFAIEVDQDLASPFITATDIVTEAVGEHVAEIVGDGATLQLGIGAIPDAALAALTSRKGLAFWSEMFSDGVLALERKGATDQSRPIVASFLFGSPELYSWVDKNPRVRLFRTEVTNDPVRIAQHHQMTAINTAIQVDLFAQANANHVRGRIYSGFGGQTDFTVGALHSKGGHAVIALGSWHPKTDSSTVVGCINGPVTSFQHSALVTEWGSAHILGRSQRAQARLIIENIAHPRAKDELREKALHLGLT